MKHLSNGADSTVLAETQASKAELYTEVRDQNGVLVGKVERSQIPELIERGWAEPVGGGINHYSNNNRRSSNDRIKRPPKYLRLTKNSPWRPQPSNRWMIPPTTQQVRADASCKYFSGAVGQKMGGLEHKPVGSDRTLYDGWRTAVRPFRLRSSGKATKP